MVQLGAGDQGHKKPSGLNFSLSFRSALLCTGFFLRFHIVASESSRLISALLLGSPEEKTMCLSPRSASKQLVVCYSFWLGLIPIPKSIVVLWLARPILCPAVVRGGVNSPGSTRTGAGKVPPQRKIKVQLPGEEMVAEQWNNRYLLYPRLYCVFPCVSCALFRTSSLTSWLFL